MVTLFVRAGPRFPWAPLHDLYDDAADAEKWARRGRVDGEYAVVRKGQRPALSTPVAFTIQPRPEPPPKRRH